MLNAYKTYAARESFFNVHGLDRNKLLHFTQKMKSFKPAIMVGYTNAFYHLSRLIKDEGIRVPKPLGIVTTAETLFPEQRHAIEDAFGCSVFNRYASSEVGVIAAECTAHEGMHIMTENVYVEILREDGTPALPGTPGKILVTDLNNLAMPLIRYDLGDIGVLSKKKCSCGRPYPCLEKVTGRLSDILQLPNGRIVFPDDLAEIFYPIQEVRKFQVLQEEKSKVTVKMVLESSENVHQLLDEIEDKLEKALEGEVVIETKIVDDIEILPSGKHRICISNLAAAG